MARKIKSKIQKPKKKEKEKEKDTYTVYRKDGTCFEYKGEVKEDQNENPNYIIGVDPAEEPPEPPEKRVINEDKKYPWQICVISIICFFFLIGLIFAGVQTGRIIERREIKENVKIQTIEKEVVKFVEKSKTPTSEFLIYLNPNLDPNLASIIAKNIDKYSQEFNLPRKLVCSIIRKESNIDPNAKSHVGAVGLMQIMPKIHREKYEGENLWHINVNVRVGCQIFRTYLDKEKGSLERTFHAYLSKNASKKVAMAYMNDIIGFWANLELYDYLSTIEREKAKEENIEEIPQIEEKVEEKLPDNRRNNKNYH